MLKLENTEVLGWEHAIRGMRNPMNSWEKSDSGWDAHIPPLELRNEIDWDEYAKHYISVQYGDEYEYDLGPNDRDLMIRLRNAGTDHRKFMRMIAVYVDITAPLYWWKEFDTYKIGTVANSCSTMHKIAAKEFTLEDFSCEHLISNDKTIWSGEIGNSMECLDIVISILNYYREYYLSMKEQNVCGADVKAKEIWWQMIQLLPSSYNQRRTVMLNYEVLANIHKSRRNHKLDEWHTFCDWIEGLPYSELITGMTESEKVARLGKKLQEGFAAGINAAKEADVERIQDAFADALGVDKTVLFGEEKIEHLVDITCSWNVEELGGDRIYAIGPGFTREDLTPYELYLLEKTEEYEKRKKEK